MNKKCFLFILKLIILIANIEEPELYTVTSEMFQIND